MYFKRVSLFPPYHVYNFHLAPHEKLALTWAFPFFSLPFGDQMKGAACGRKILRTRSD